MQLFVDAPFDIGVTFGLGDDVLTGRDKPKELREALLPVLGEKLQIFDQVEVDTLETGDYGSSVPYGVRRPFGDGLRIRVTGGPLIEAWVADALAFLEAYEGENLPEFDAEAVNDIRTGLQADAIVPERATVFVFPIGVSFVRLEWSGLTLSPAAVRLLYKIFEFAGYGELVVGDGATANRVLAETRNAVRSVYASAAEKIKLMKRTEADDQLLIYGFWGIVALDGHEEITGDDPEFFRPGDTIETFEYGTSKLHFSWWILTVDPQSQREVAISRLLYICMICNLSWELCRLAEQHFGDLIRQRIDASISGKRFQPLDRRALNRVKQISTYILSSTSLAGVTAYSGDIAVFERFDKSADIAGRHKRITAANAAFAEAEQDENFALETRQAQRLNTILLVLTVASLTGIAAAIIDAYADGMNLLSSPLLYGAVLGIPPLVTLLVMLVLIKVKR